MIFLTASTRFVICVEQIKWLTEVADLSSTQRLYSRNRLSTIINSNPNPISSISNYHCWNNCFGFIERLLITLVCRLSCTLSNFRTFNTSSYSFAFLLSLLLFASIFLGWRNGDFLFRGR